MILKQVNKPRLADIVEKQIREYIQKEKFQPGDVLPGEIELTRQLGISRSVLREALSQLRMLGLLQASQGKGMVVSEPAVLHPMERIVSTGILSESSSQDLFEMRLILEMGICELVLMFVTDEHIKKLEKLVEKGKNYPVGSIQSINCDIEFHKTLYDITGNKMLIHLHDILSSFFVKASQLITDHSPDRTPKVSHEQLLQYIKNKDSVGFMIAMKDHLEQQFNLIVKNRKGEKSSDE